MLDLLSAFLLCLAAKMTIGLYWVTTGGAPSGNMALSGKPPGRLPQQMRALSVFRGLLLTCFAVLMLLAAGPSGWIVGPFGVLSIAIAISAMSFLAHAVARSRSEWGFSEPVTRTIRPDSLGAVPLGRVRR